MVSKLDLQIMNSSPVKDTGLYINSVVETRLLSNRTFREILLELTLNGWNEKEQRLKEEIKFLLSVPKWTIYVSRPIVQPESYSVSRIESERNNKGNP